jgi:hypothetical protein
MIRRLNWLGMVIVVITSFGQAASAADPPKGIAAIWAYAGVWKIDIENFDTAHSKAGHEKSTLHNSCWKGGEYVVCNQYVDGDSKILLVFTYSSKDNVYTSYQIPKDGGAAGKGTLRIEGNVWTFPWETTEKDVTTYFRVVNTWTTPDHIDFRQEYSTDKTHWTLMAKGEDVRVSKN